MVPAVFGLNSSYLATSLLLVSRVFLLGRCAVGWLLDGCWMARVAQKDGWQRWDVVTRRC